MKTSAVRKKSRIAVSAAQLRRRAEAQLRKQQKNPRPGAGARNSAAEARRLLSELQVHQIELEMQNAELQAARDKAEELLEKYTELYDFAPISYFSLDERGRIIEVNLTGAALFAVERSRLVNRSLQRFVGSANLPILLSFLKLVFSEPGVQICEMKLLKPDGTAFWASLHGESVNSGSGSAKLCRVAVSDITSLKEAEEAKLQIEAAAIANRDLQREIVRRKKVENALRHSEEALIESGEHLRLAAEAAEFGAFQYDFAHHEWSYTPEFLAQFGLPAGATFEKNSDFVPQAIHPDDKAAYLAGLQAAADQHNDSATFDMEFRILRPDGEVRCLRAHGRIAFTGRGPNRHPLRANGIIQDITSRKQSEQEIAQQRNELAHFSRITALGEMAASLAHELNQPLTAILSNAQAAQRFIAHDRADLNEIREILADIVAEDKRAGDVIRHMRALLKKGEVQRQPLDANEVIREVLTILRNDLVNQGITAQTELAPDLSIVYGDHVQFQQVLLGLVMNACDSMAGVPRNDRQLMICTDMSGDNFVRISVADRGVGIAPENLEKVFNPFYTTKPNGMGFGLTVCRTIVAAHGGKLWAANNPDRGSTFHLLFPTRGKERGASSASSSAGLNNL
jgi:PAS domain S-box-containing protein